MAINGSTIETSLPGSSIGPTSRAQDVHESLPSLASGKGLIDQLADNPFFTAVRLCVTLPDTSLY